MICTCVKVDLNKGNQPTIFLLAMFFIPKIDLWLWRFLFRDLPWLLVWKKHNWCQCSQERVQVLRNENVCWFAWWSPTFLAATISSLCCNVIQLFAATIQLWTTMISTSLQALSCAAGVRTLVKSTVPPMWSLVRQTPGIFNRYSYVPTKKLKPN